MGAKRKLVKIGKVSVKNAIGFFWHDRHKIYVVSSPEDIEEFKSHGYEDSDLHPMEELEQAFRDSEALRFISWCNLGSIVREGARQVTFDYGEDKVVIHIR